MASNKGMIICLIVCAVLFIPVYTFLSSMLDFANPFKFMDLVTSPFRSLGSSLGSSLGVGGSATDIAGDGWDGINDGIGGIGDGIGGIGGL